MINTIATFDEPGHHLFATSELAGGFVAADAVNSLLAGDRLSIVAEPTNEYDPYAVAVYFNDHKIGYVPGATGSNINQLVHAVLAARHVVCIVGVVIHNPAHLRDRIRLSYYARCM